MNYFCLWIYDFASSTDYDSYHLINDDQLEVCAHSLIIETIKIAATTLFLNIAYTYLLRVPPGRKANQFREGIFARALYGPIIEEILCRRLVHRAIYHIQIAYNNYLGREKLTEEQKLTEKIVRLVLSAILFMLPHCFNVDSNKAIQLPVTLIGGLAYGALAEKYHTLVVGIFLHSFNNGIVEGAMLDPREVFIYAFLTNKVAAYALAFPEAFIWMGQILNSLHAVLPSDYIWNDSYKSYVR